MLVTMTDKELYRLGIIQRVFDRALLQRDAADILKLSVRQVQRLVRLYRTDGATAFASSRRGRPANNRIDEETRCKALDLIRCHYSDFGPTLATEKLAERHHIHLSVETVRNWMTADGLWRPHSRRRTRVYQPRYRRDCLGELVQIDGSHHDWFEGRAPKCCLLVFMDDATGRIMHLRFGETESAFDYMLATREYVEKHGKPLAFYSDKHGIFRVNHAAGSKSGTQFGRVLHDIGVELICANSPQAKGRVERANKTLQDRLIKEMRLNKISSIEEANAWLETFIVNFNQRFAKTPKYPKNLHRPVAETIVDLDDIFSWQETRKLSKSLTFRYDKMIYLVEPTEENTRIAGENIKVLDYLMAPSPSNTATAPSPIRYSINWTVSIRGKLSIISDSVQCSDWLRIKWMNWIVTANVSEAQRCRSGVLRLVYRNSYEQLIQFWLIQKNFVRA